MPLMRCASLRASCLPNHASYHSSRARYTIPIAQATTPIAQPDGFAEFQLGLPIEEVKLRLRESELFRYRGDADVSFLPAIADQTLIDVEGDDIITRGLFQFHQMALYIIILQLDIEQIDYYSLYTTLTERYGEPYDLDPQRAMWRFPASAPAISDSPLKEEAFTADSETDALVADLLETEGPEEELAETDTSEDASENVPEADALEDTPEAEASTEAPSESAVQVELILEHPATIKYIDVPLFNQVRDEVDIPNSERYITRDNFLQLF